MVVSVDLWKMNRIKWIDKKNMMICVEGGLKG
jgi:FAD/FMN-containing dehydrogenase